MILTSKEMKFKRLEHNIKQKEFAKILGISVVHLSRIENNVADGLKFRLKATEYFNNLDKNNQEDLK